MLKAAGLAILVVEASDRVGGRARTVEHQGLPLDLGCGWLHSADRNPWVPIADELGFAIDRTPPPWGRQAGDLAFTPEEQRAAREAYDAWEARLREEPPASDCAADSLEVNQRFNPYIEALSGFINGAELAHLSVRDYLAYADAETGINWRVVRGYGALVAQAAADLPVVLSNPVTALEIDGSHVRLATEQGPIEASHVIVTVPTNLLASAALRLPPALDEWAAAAADLPLGLANKLFFHLEDAEGFEPDTQVLGRPGAEATGSYHLRPFGRPVIEAFVGGGTARALEAEGPEAMTAFALAELAGLFGSDIRRQLRPVALSEWGKCRFAGGSYSHALPGRSAARKALARPYDGRIFFAGEGCSEQDFSTAHGAWETGVAAARSILQLHRQQ